MRFNFVHAADLHLDAVLPFAAPRSAPASGSVADSLWREAPFLALRRLVDFCLASKASILLLAGDVYDSRQGSLKARLELREACQRLGEAGVYVFWARGNHDALDEDQSFINWPDNLTIFDEAGQSYALGWKNGNFAPPRLLAPGEKLPGEAVLVHGISHAGPRESANLALRLQESIGKLALAPAAPGSRFSLGVLHCNVGGSSGSQPGSQPGAKSGGHENYAPCALGELTAAPVDYWALGHIHQPGVLAENPPVVYAGCPQGLHVRESGPRGCLLGRVDEGRLESFDFHPLAALRWERLELNLSALEGETGEEGTPPGLEELEEFILREIQGFSAALFRGESTAGAEHPCRQLVLRLALTGRSSLDGILRQGDNLPELCARLNRRLNERDGQDETLALPPARLKDIKLDTRPAVDLEEILAGDNLVSETLRRALALSPGPLAEGQAAEYLALLDSLYSGVKGEAWLAELRPGPQELPELAREAAALCLDLFEVE